MAQDIMVKCPICQDFLEGRDYQNHMLTNHKDQIIKTWSKCPDCVDLFPNLYKLEIHKLMAHTGVILKKS